VHPFCLADTSAALSRCHIWGFSIQPKKVKKLQGQFFNTLVQIHLATAVPFVEFVPARSRVWWCAPVFPTIQEAEAIG
jgi:hypothetical protein